MLGPPLLRMRYGRAPRNRPLTRMCYHAKFGHSRSNSTRVHTPEIYRDSWALRSRLSRSLVVIRTDRDQLSTCDCGDTGVSGLTRGLATLPKVDPGAFSGQRLGWKTPRRTLWQCTASVCVVGVHCWEISLG